MHFVYILQSETKGTIYVGATGVPDERLRSHNSGKVRSTKVDRPWKRIWLEEYEEKSRALKRERYLKSGWGRQWILKNVIGRDG